MAIADCLDGLTDQIATENDRLRAALTEIRDAHPTVVSWSQMNDGTWREACRDLQRIARTALVRSETEGQQ